jgi:methylglutaconyl-CoA hydratase
MANYSFLKIDRRGPIATVTLNRPEVHNAFNSELIAELAAAMNALGTDAQVRIVVLSGVGRSFSAGADVNWMRETVTYTYEQNLADARRLAEMFHTIADCPKPVIARVHGSAFGGGVGLVAACDIAVAVKAAEFAFSEVRLGIVPAVISPFVLARIGAGAARRYFLTAERFSAEEAQRIGLISQVVSDEAALNALIEERISQLLQGGPQALALCKQLIATVDRSDPETARTYTTETIAQARVSEEGQAGLRAFLGKRPAPWRPS